MTRQEIGTILQELREKAHKTREEVGDLLGKSAKTVGHWETGYASPDANTLFLLCTIYGADLNEAFGFKSSRPKTSKAALQLARDYDALDAWGRKALRALADAEMARCEDESQFLAETAPEPEPKVITLYRDPAAAGYLTGDTQSEGEPYVLGPADPLGAEYAVVIQGDSMEPAFPDGSIAFVNHDQMRDGDIGIFCVDGKTVIKQWHYDRMLGITYLFSINRARADADVTITRSSGRALVWQGRVIAPKSYPLPTM